MQKIVFIDLMVPEFLLGSPILAARSTATSLRTGKFVKHIAVLGFATLGMILRSIFVASRVDCV